MTLTTYSVRKKNQESIDLSVIKRSYSDDMHTGVQLHKLDFSKTLITIQFQ